MFGIFWCFENVVQARVETWMSRPGASAVCEAGCGRGRVCVYVLKWSCFVESVMMSIMVRKRAEFSRFRSAARSL